MRDTSALPTMSVEEYFRFEERSTIKHEYVAGEVYAMSGATWRHNLITGTVFGLLLGAEGTGSCRVAMSDMRVEVDHDRYYYPDVVVICTPVAELDIVARGPCVVVEVTSPSTARIDRGEKLDAYRRIPALRAYFIVDHRRRRVQRHWRESADAAWMSEEIVGEAQAPIPVPCLDVNLTLDAIYRRVVLPGVHEPETAEYDIVDDEGQAEQS
jgi:Uma2 family endonuclease